MEWSAFLQQALQHRTEQHALRRRTTRRAACAMPFIDWPDGRCLNFGGNDYLGLSRDETVTAAWQQALSRYGCGSGASPLVCGHTDRHQALEDALCNWLGYEAALLFASGFAANQAVLHALLDSGSVLMADKLCHASMQEAAAHSPAKVRRFAHQRYDVLADWLQAGCSSRVLVASEGVFSMDGDCADLPRLQQLCRAHGAWLLLDDAHGIGIRGEEGKGSAAAAGIHPEILVVTFGKAFGNMGAAVLCSRTAADYLCQTARHLIYSTAVPPAQADALLAAVTRIRQADDLRARLDGHIALFRHTLAEAGLADDLLPSSTPIQPFICGSNENALRLSAHLRRLGLYVPAIRPPTVPHGQARLRITLSAAHETEHIIRLCEGIRDAV